MYNKIFEMIKNMAENVPFFDVQNVVGNPVKVEGVGTIFPLVKICVGSVGGGADDFLKSCKKHSPFLGAATSGISAEPLGFLVVTKNSQQILTLENTNAFSGISKILVKAFSNYVKKSGTAKLKRVKEKMKNAKN